MVSVMLLLLLFLFPVVAVAELGRDKLNSPLHKILLSIVYTSVSIVLSLYTCGVADGVCDAAAAPLHFPCGCCRRVGAR